MSIVTINYLLTIIAIVWIFVSKKPQNAFVPLFIAGFSGIPIYYFGKSSSGGIFPVDILAVSFLLRFGVFNGRMLIRTIISRHLFYPFLVLILWISFSGIFALTQTDYGEKYFNFLLYGMGRWWTFFLFVILLFSLRFNEEEFSSIMRKLFFAFSIYGVVLLLHQHGIIKFSGIEGLGPRIAEQAERTFKEFDIESMFWGANRASVGAICFTGFWFGILFRLTNKGFKWKRNATILSILMVICLMGTWSRSDFVALCISFLLWYVISERKIGRRTKAIGIIAGLLLFNVWAVLTIIDIQIESPTIDRYADVVKNKWFEEGSGAHRKILHAAIINQLMDNPQTLLTGLGPNGFRVLYGQVNIWTNAAHNAFLHILTELGFIGLILILYWLFRVISLWKKVPALMVSSQIFNERKVFYPIMLSFIMGRFISGYAVDTLFAVDAMLPSNIMLLGFLGLLISKRQ